MTNVIDMTGNRYSSLVAIRTTGKAASGDIKWLFKCDCGVEFEANGYYARSGKIISCPGCSTHRTKLASVKHGLSNTPEFSTWTDIQTRCNNQSSKFYKNYGGRGIQVCTRWTESFENFLADIGFRPGREFSIDRIDNNGNYEPSNCRWATRVEQANNKRNNVKVTIDGITKNISTWAKEYGVCVSTASIRYRDGFCGESIFKTTKQTITHAGITDTIKGWSNRTGIKPSTISMRINHYQWPVEKALTKGVIL